MTTESVNSIENDNESLSLDREMSRSKSTPLIRNNEKHKSFQSNEIENRFFDRLNVKNYSRNKKIETESLVRQDKDKSKENENSKDKEREKKSDEVDKDGFKINEKDKKDEDRKKNGGNDKNPLLMTKSRLLVQYDDFEKDKNEDGEESELNGDEVKDTEDANKSEGTGEEEDEEGKIENEDADNKKNGNLNRKGKVFLSKYFSINFSCCRLLQWMVILQAYKTVLQIH